ncbi:Os01g0838725, partial [Oryza sativa Japonica Group]
RRPSPSPFESSASLGTQATLTTPWSTHRSAATSTIVVVRPFSTTSEQATAPSSSPHPPLQYASRTPAGDVKDLENTSFLHRRRSRIASAVIIDYRCLGEPLFDSLRIHHLLDLTTLVHACLKQLIVPFEPSSFTRGGAPSPSRSTSHRCRQDLDNPSSTHDNCIIGEEVD